MRSRLLLSLIVGGPLAAQTARPPAPHPTLSPAVRQFVSVDTPIVALTHVRVIDGTGAPPRADQTVVIRDGRIESIDPASSGRIPAGAQVLDLTGKSVIPGLVMVHEHLYYPTGPGTYANLTESFVRLYLAGGVTSMRTGGNMNGYSELNMKRAIDRGERAGPWIDATAPYLEGPGLPLLQVHELTDAADARRLVDFWADNGATSLKAYMHITRDELKAAIDEGHKRGMKITGHLCSVTYREAADLGIDDLEHGFFASSDFVKDKKPDDCPGGAQVPGSLAALDPGGDAVKSLIRHLIDRHVALTSTLTVFETFTPGQPKPPGLEVLVPELRDQFEQRYQVTQRSANSPYATLFTKLRRLEIDFFRAGGLLLAGTDPTGGGGVIPGYSDQRAVELLVEGGLTPLEAIKVATLNGATYLGRADRVGSIAVGRQADLVVLDGDPSANIGDVRKVDLVFKSGVGYDPAKLIASVRGKVGLY
ncbi:MAG TPA: amidohydrolase family protein [Gemmatimonadaceae bacterium]|jgi:imidazolonepropionase-like amidohydrolase|nr:amidohydrolase family protein [Gemmatimonadaceae bacterium]